MPRCKECGINFVPKYFNQKMCLDNDICLKAFADFARETEQKRQIQDWKKRKPILVEDNKKVPEFKNDLQKEINKIARLIDGDLPCISCGTQNPVQYAGGHRKSVGSHPNIRYHLDNIHKQCNNYCNKNLSGFPDGYDSGLLKRYGPEYLDTVLNLTLKHKELKISKDELIEKIAIARKIIRDFSTFQFEDPLQARHQINKILNIY